jgi:hypothetical protein
MAEGWGPTAANHALDTECALYTWVKLHLGAPGSAGTANPATETTRKQVTEAAASGGSKASSADLVWTSIVGSEDATHFTRWTASTAGTFGFSGTVTANPYTAGDTLTIPSGSMTTSVVLAS